MEYEENKIAAEILTKGYCTPSFKSECEKPEEWDVFRIWFYVRKDMFIDFDWHDRRYTFFLPGYEKEANDSKPHSSQSFDRYESETILKSLLKNIDIVDEISKSIKEKGVYISNNPTVAGLIENEDQRNVLIWFVTEHTEYFKAFTNGEITIFYNADEELMKNIAKVNNFKYSLVRPDYIDEEDEWNPEEDDFEVILDGFIQYTLFA